ncbi:MAG: tetratricopeptide repeat protein [Phycisphaerae bacterium]|nr:tetratricopeptide repeat protein [Phycisphaerae bacterium]MCZ2399118.1 tetratricopeptide repeat protein [Phycisphaerae bacterium]
MFTATRPPRSAGAIERLYVLWLVSTLVLLMLVVALAVFGASVVERQGRALRELAARQGAVEQQLARRVAAPPAPQRELAPQTEAAAPSPVTVPSAPAREAPPPRADAAGEPPAALTSSVVDARLDRVLRPGRDQLYELVDERAARELLAQATLPEHSAALSGAVHARLAALAALLRDDALAELLAFGAEERGTPPVAFLQIVGRRRLLEGRVEEARALAFQLWQLTPRSPAAQLLAAEALMAPPETAPAEADSLLDQLAHAPRLSAGELGRLGQLAVRLERWDVLRRVVADLAEVDGASGEFDLLRAIAAIHERKNVEALAILEYLREQNPADYDVNLWRAVALLNARSFEAARQTLEALPPDAPRPEGWYWRGILALRRGDADGAARFLQAALTVDARYAPAYEALAAQALERQDVTAAVQHLDLATRAAPRRASAYFLLSLAFAKSSRKDDAAAALRQALALDVDLLATARATEVLTRLFSEDELAALATPASAPATTVPAGAAPGGPAQ